MPLFELDNKKANQELTTIDEVGRIFMQSFRFSQGRPELQLILFKATKLFRPSLKITDSQIKEIANYVSEPINNYVFAGKNQKTNGQRYHTLESKDGIPLTQANLKNEINRQLVLWQRITEWSFMPARLNADLSLFADTTVTEDLTNLNRGRNYSVLLTYIMGLPGKTPLSTSVVEFDQFFEQVREFVQEGKLASREPAINIIALRLGLTNDASFYNQLVPSEIVPTLHYSKMIYY